MENKKGLLAIWFLEIILCGVLQVLSYGQHDPAMHYISEGASLVMALCLAVTFRIFEKWNNAVITEFQQVNPIKKKTFYNF